MPALVAATNRSAAAMSGRRCNRVEGTPAGTLGSFSRSPRPAMEKSGSRLAHQAGDGMFQQRAARRTSDSCACASESWVWARPTSRPEAMPLSCRSLVSVQRLADRRRWRRCSSLRLRHPGRAAQIVVGQLRLQAAAAPPARSAKLALRLRLARRHFVADPSPQIQVPGQATRRPDRRRNKSAGWRCAAAGWRIACRCRHGRRPPDVGEAAIAPAPDSPAPRHSAPAPPPESDWRSRSGLPGRSGWRRHKASTRRRRGSASCGVASIQGPVSLKAAGCGVSGTL